MAEYKINRRPKDDVTIEELADETINKLNKKGFNGEKFIEILVNKMGEKGIIKSKEIGWNIIYNENKNHYDENGNENDQKYNNEKEHENQPLSQLINAQDPCMCIYGHGTSCGDEKFTCIMCGAKGNRVHYCGDCDSYAIGKGMNNDRNRTLFSYCADCTTNNAINIKNRVKMNELKGKIMRKELLKDATLEMDLLCNMKRATALKGLIFDINKLPIHDRKKWCLFAMDLDHLKCWNDCLGHVKADELIQKIGGIMQRYVNDINSGKWVQQFAEKTSLFKGFIYRTGGDEFTAVIEGGTGGQMGFYGKGIAGCPLGSFYGKMKNEINELGKNIKNLLNINDNDWVKIKKNLNDAKDRQNNKIDMSCVGISCGIYIPTFNDEHIFEEDWLEKADKIALEHAKTIHLPKKNGVSIYCEDKQCLVDDNKVEKCLKDGVAAGFNLLKY